MMPELLAQSWWMLALRGLAALVFGVLVVLWPGLTLLVLVALFAAYTLVSGVASAIGAVQNRSHDEDWWLILLLGLVSIGAGLIAMFHPALTTLILALLLGAYAVATGILDIAAAIRLRKTIRGEWLLILAGIVSVAFGAIVLLYPGAGALALVWLIGAYAIAEGALLLLFAFRIRSIRQRTGERRTGLPDRRVGVADRRVPA